MAFHPAPPAPVPFGVPVPLQDACLRYQHWGGLGTSTTPPTPLEVAELGMQTEAAFTDVAAAPPHGSPTTKRPPGPVTHVLSPRKRKLHRLVDASEVEALRTENKQIRAEAAKVLEMNKFLLNEVKRLAVPVQHAPPRVPSLSRTWAPPPIPVESVTIHPVTEKEIEDLFSDLSEHEWNQLLAPLIPAEEPWWKLD